MLTITRRDLAAVLASYGEHDSSARIESMSAEDFSRVCEIGSRYALTGMLLAKASSLAAIEVLEGKPRELRRRRRDWSDVPPSLLVPDTIALAVAARIERYAGGVPVGRSDILNALSAALAAALPSFRYFKSYAHFRHPFIEGISYIDLDYSKGTVALRFGVRHNRVEALKSRLFESARPAANHYTRTISKYSYNMGPGSPHWRYPTEPTWPVSGSEGLTIATSEIVEFVEQVAVPYVSTHQDPLNIRGTLVTEPGRSDGWAVDATIFAVDFLLRRKDWLEEDLRILQKRYAQYDRPNKESLEIRYRATVEKWDEAI